MSLRTDVDAVLISLLRGVSEADLAIVLLACNDGSAEALPDRITAQVRSEQVASRPAVVPIPDSLKGTEGEAAWRGAILDAGEDLIRSQKGSADLASRCPELLGRAQEQAAEANRQAEGLRRSIAELDEKLKDLAERRELHQSRRGRSAPLLARMQWYRRAEIGLWTMEFAVIFATCAAYFGLFDGAAYAPDAWRTWLQVLMVSLPATLVTFTLAIGSSKIIQRLPQSRTLLVAAAGAVLSGFVVFGLSLGVLRWSASQTAYDLSNFATAIGSDALLVIVTVTSLVVAGAAVWFRLQCSKLAEDSQGLRNVEEDFAEREGRLFAERQAIGDRLEQLGRVAMRPGEFKVAFERGVQVIVRSLRDEATLVGDRVEAAQCAYRYLKGLSPAMRDEIVTQLYHLRRVEQDGDQPKARLSTLLRTGLPAAGLLVGLVLGGLPLTGCGRPPVATVRIVACDGTGASQEDVCNPHFLVSAFAEFGGRAVQAPGSAFVVAMSGGSFSSTTIQPALVVPSLRSGGPRTASVDWIREGIQTVGALPVPVDSEENARINKSDLLSLVVLAASKAREYPSAQTELILASDGWFVSEGYNAAERTPDVEEVVGRMEHQLHLDFSALDVVHLCGFHNIGTTAAADQARRAFWVGFFEAGGAKVTDLRASCRDLYPDPDPRLLAHDGDAAALANLEGR